MHDDTKERRPLRLGTRGSQLARWQAEWVAGELRRMGHEVELVEIATRGDVDHGRTIEELGTRGVFTKEIQRALVAGEVDLGVHSLKDLPTEPVDGLMVAAVPARASAADVVAGTGDWEPGAGGAGVDEKGGTNGVAMLPPESRVGTGSLRRRAQLLHVRPDLRVADIRGNVETRLRKLDDGQFDAIVLAEAGLRRLELPNRISYVLPMDIMLPAVGQGALGIECRTDDVFTLSAVAPLENPATRMAVTAERALLAHLRGGCMAPVGAWGRIENGVLKLSAVVLSPDGRKRLAASDSVGSNDATALGHRVAEQLLAQGAGALIAASRSN